MSIQAPTPEELANAYVAALNAGDVDAIVALYAPDATVEDPVGSTPHRGHEAIRAFYSRSLQVPLQVQMEGQVRVAGRECAFAFSVALNYQGRAMVIRPIDTFVFNEAGQVVQMRAYFGPGNFSAQ